MAGYKERIADEIKRQRVLHGEDPLDVAYAIKVNPRTYERWESAEREPRLSNLRALASHWEVEIADLRPDLEAEEKQLERLEGKLDLIIEHLGLEAEGAADEPDDVDLLTAAEEPSARLAGRGSAEHPAVKPGRSSQRSA